MIEPDTVHRMAAHVCNLAKANNVKIFWDVKDGFRSSYSNPKLREIHVSKVQGYQSYVTALHELGHIANDMGGGLRAHHSTLFYRVTDLMTPWDADLQMIEELNAWHWALQNALFWNKDMSRNAEYALGSYERNRLRMKQGYEGFIKTGIGKKIMALYGLDGQIARLVGRMPG